LSCPKKGNYYFKNCGVRNGYTIPSLLSTYLIDSCTSEKLGVGIVSEKRLSSFKNLRGLTGKIRVVINKSVHTKKYQVAIPIVIGIKYQDTDAMAMYFPFSPYQVSSNKIFSIFNPDNYRDPFSIHHSPFTIHHSPFTINNSPFTIHNLTGRFFNLRSLFSSILYLNRAVSEVPHFNTATLLSGRGNFRSLFSSILLTRVADFVPLPIAIVDGSTQQRIRPGPIRGAP
jgi:hypothetical protein